MNKLHESKLFKEFINLPSQDKEGLYRNIVDEIMVVLQQRCREVASQIKEKRGSRTDEVSFEIDYEYSEAENTMITRPERPNATLLFNASSITEGIPTLKRLQSVLFDKELSWIDEIENKEEQKSIDKEIRNSVVNLFQKSMDFGVSGKFSGSDTLKDLIIQSTIGKKNGSQKYNITPIFINTIEIFPKQVSDEGNAIIIPIAKSEDKIKEILKSEGRSNSKVEVISASTLQKYSKMATLNETDIRSEILEHKDTDPDLRFIEDVRVECYSTDFEIYMWIDFSRKEINE